MPIEVWRMLEVDGHVVSRDELIQRVEQLIGSAPKHPKEVAGTTSSGLAPGDLEEQVHAVRLLQGQIRPPDLIRGQGVRGQLGWIVDVYKRQVDVILGIGSSSPSVPFERAEFVRGDQTYSILSRIVKATQVDTILHTFLVVDSTLVPARALHEIDVIGTMNLLAAAGAPGSPVRHIVFKSSTLVYGATEKDPNTFSEDTPRSFPPSTQVERALVEAEGLVRDFAEENPDVVVSTLRFANVLGTCLLYTSRCV